MSNGGLEVDPNANPIVRANARIIVKWRAINETWARNVRSTATWWLIWELTWPFLALSTLALWVYMVVSSLVTYPIDRVW